MLIKHIVVGICLCCYCCYCYYVWVGKEIKKNHLEKCCQLDQMSIKCNVRALYTTRRKHKYTSIVAHTDHSNQAQQTKQLLHFTQTVNVIHVRNYLVIVRWLPSRHTQTHTRNTHAEKLEHRQGSMEPILISLVCCVSFHLFFSRCIGISSSSMNPK